MASYQILLALFHPSCVHGNRILTGIKEAGRVEQHCGCSRVEAHGPLGLGHHLRFLFILALNELGRGIYPSPSQRVLLTTEALIEVQGCQMS